MNGILFRPYVYFQLEQQNGHKYRYHINVLVPLPNGVKATLQPVSSPGSGSVREIEILVEADPGVVNTEPMHFGYKVNYAEMSASEKRGGFLVRINNESGVLMTASLAEAPQSNHDYDDADGYPAGT